MMSSRQETKRRKRDLCNPRLCQRKKFKINAFSGVQVEVRSNATSPLHQVVERLRACRRVANKRSATAYHHGARTAYVNSVSNS